MKRTRLLVAIEDDGSTVTLVVDRFETIGAVEIGPVRVIDKQCLSFPAPTVDQWQRDMVVQVLEYL